MSITIPERPFESFQKISRAVVSGVMAGLKETGSHMVRGFMDPEGVVIYLPGSRVLLKETYEFSDGKWQEAALPIAA